MSVPSSQGSSAPTSRNPVPWIVGGSCCALLALLTVAAMVLGGLWFAGQREVPEDVVSRYLSAWESQDCETYEEITTEHFRGLDYSCAQWREDVRWWNDNSYDFEHELGEGEVEGDRATVQVTETLIHPDATEQQVYEFVLQRDGLSWRIHSTRTIQGFEET